MKIWIIGRKLVLPDYTCMTEPFICFEAEADAHAACDMIEKVSGERPMIADGVLYRVGETMR